MILDQLPQRSQALVAAQFENAGRSPEGRRFTPTVLNVALWLYHYSAAAYKALRQMLYLPSPRALRLHLRCLFQEVRMKLLYTCA